MAGTRPATRRKQKPRHRRIQYEHTSGLHCRCGKVRGYSEREAWQLAEQAMIDHPEGEPARRVYECDVERGIWHWTRRESWDPKETQ